MTGLSPTRRAFLGTLAAAVAGVSFDPERLLWVPGRKTIVDLAGPRLVVPPYTWSILSGRVSVLSEAPWDGGASGMYFHDSCLLVTDAVLERLLGGPPLFPATNVVVGNHIVANRLPTPIER